MNGFELRQKAKRGDLLYGTMWAYCNPRQVAMVSSKDLDFIVLDNEHSPNGRDSTAEMIQRVVGAGIAPIVRVPSPDPVRIRMALDAGSHGVVIPYCESPEEVRRCVAAARFRPLKGVKLEEAIRLGGPPNPTTRAYLEQYN